MDGDRHLGRRGLTQLWLGRATVEEGPEEASGGVHYLSTRGEGPAFSNILLKIDLFKCLALVSAF